MHAPTELFFSGDFCLIVAVYILLKNMSVINISFVLIFFNNNNNNNNLAFCPKLVGVG
jgi:hypothetical protein